ncbi:MAG: outer membrane beta-barrel protein [Bacteroidetes bacterium]|nr:outer membrane beta-barrel protein [Bacteroidota bacterium]
MIVHLHFRKNYFILLFISLLLFSFNLSAQLSVTDTVAKTEPAIKVSGYVDAYYAYYTDSVGDNKDQQFPSISPRSKTFGLNTAMITAQYDGEKTRGIVSLHFGDIARSAWSPVFNPIMEAHAGIRLCSKLWIDAGFFRTHFGTEGLLPKENICSSVSVNTFYEPYYESGVRLNYNPCEKLALYFYALNGYNMYEDNNHKKSFGMLANYTMADDKGSFGYSNYIGDDSPTGDTISHLRIHQNLFFNYQYKKMKIQVGGDFCYQKNSFSYISKKPGMMGSGVMSFKYQCCKSSSVYTRGEIFQDPSGFMSTRFIDWEGNVTGYKLWGTTVGVEYKPTENSYLRAEVREISMDQWQKIFYTNGKDVSTRTELLINMGISF